MTSILSTGTGALLAYQRAMSTVSGNVANIGTTGYTRQSTQLSTLYTGGVQVQDVVRIADELVNARLLDSTGELARLDKISTLSSQVDTMMSDKTTNLNSVWSNFFDSVSALTSTPTSSSARQAVLDNAKALATRFNQIDAQPLGDIVERAAHAQRRRAEHDGRLVTVEQVCQSSRDLQRRRI